MTEESKRKPKSALLLVATLWLGGIGAGSLALLDHEFAAGQPNEAPVALPAQLAPFASPQKPLTLFMAVHPDCPCTGASLEQVDRLIARNPDSIQVVGLVRSAPDAELRDNSYWKRLLAMPHARAVADIDGELASLLGTHVSGATIAYDPDGHLRFQGGMTASRGHAGPSRGMDDLEAIARQLAPLDLCSTPTFGCSLENASDLL